MLTHIQDACSCERNRILSSSCGAAGIWCVCLLESDGSFGLRLVGAAGVAAGFVVVGLVDAAGVAAGLVGAGLIGSVGAFVFCSLFFVFCSLWCVCFFIFWLCHFGGD